MTLLDVQMVSIRVARVAFVTSRQVQYDGTLCDESRSPLLTQQASAAGVSELLTKPLQSREIATTLARVLHRTA
jgi:CheY-like chemotaxis protein